MTVPEDLQVIIHNMKTMTLQGRYLYRFRSYLSYLRRLRTPDVYRYKGLFISGERVRRKRRREMR